MAVRPSTSIVVPPVGAASAPWRAPMTFWPFTLTSRARTTPGSQIPLRRNNVSPLLRSTTLIPSIAATNRQPPSPKPAISPSCPAQSPVAALATI